jgi:hypothetical protein
VNISGKTEVKKLIASSTSSHKEGLQELLSCIVNYSYLDLDGVQPQKIIPFANLLLGISYLSLNYSSRITDQQVNDLVKKSHMKEISFVNTIGEKALKNLLGRWKEIPSLVRIHIHENLSSVSNP